MAKKKNILNENLNSRFNKIKDYVLKRPFLSFYILILTPLALLSLILLDPDFGLINSLEYGSVLINTLLFVVYGILSSTLLWITCAAFNDYGDYGDMETLAKKATEDAVSTANYILAMCVKSVAYAIVIVGGFFAMK